MIPHTHILSAAGLPGDVCTIHRARSFQGSGAACDSILGLSQGGRVWDCSRCLALMS